MFTIKLAFCSTPNTALPSPDKKFYISYNNIDTSPSLYGSDTTALVKGQMDYFYILNGDHYSKYKKLIPQGFDACMAYFLDNLHLMNKRSDLPKSVLPN